MYSSKTETIANASGNCTGRDTLSILGMTHTKMYPCILAKY
jgi:hypothetical protein